MFFIPLFDSTQNGMDGLAMLMGTGKKYMGINRQLLYPEQSFVPKPERRPMQ
jgi:hypothetical protein